MKSIFCSAAGNQLDINRKLEMSPNRTGQLYQTHIIEVILNLKCAHACARAYMREYVCACVLAFLNGCVCACIRTCVSVCVVLELGK